jgi:CheY-like chemotaxis protein
MGNMTKIMLVEDDKSLREIYGVRLLAEGYDIISAGDGEEALAMAIKDRPQLIISDVMMPKISGFDMLDILRSTTETKNIRVIMMTALSSDEQRQRGEQLGADKYLVKSQVGIEDVVKAVHEVLGDTPGAANAPNPVASPSDMPPVTPGSQPVSIVDPTAAPASSIPEPTAPFTGVRPASLGERVIQPLPDNPRVPTVDMDALATKEDLAGVQSVENIPDPVIENSPEIAPGGIPVTPPPTVTTLPVDSSSTMPQPAAIATIDPTVDATPVPSDTTVVATPLQYEEAQAPTSVSPPAPQPAPSIAVPERPVTPPLQ